MLGALKHLLTGKDNSTYAPARVYWCLGAVQFLALSLWSTVHKGNPFDPVPFATALGLVLTAGGAGVWITSKTEPSA